VDAPDQRPDDLKQPERQGFWGVLDQTAASLARIAGLILLLVGVWAAVQVLGEAWELYRHPDRVSRFADAVEQGTHIDRALLPANRRATTTGESGYAATGDDFRPSHILGWALAIILLLVLGRLAYWILLAGSSLAHPTGWPDRRRQGKR